MPKRSLMLAGGGLKIAFQAGVLQVWLDEAGIEFDNADAVSAACFNLAMWVQGMSGEWHNGFVGNFFGIFEATTNGGYRRILARIATSNAAIERGTPGEFGRYITVRELRSEVALHYLFNFSKPRFAEAVNRGVEVARAWCDTNRVA